MSGIRIPEFPDFIPTTRLSKVVRRSSSAPHLRQNTGRWLPLPKLYIVMFWSWLWSINRDLVALSHCSPSPNSNLPSTRWQWVLIQSAIAHISWISFLSSAANEILIWIINICIISSSRSLIWMWKWICSFKSQNLASMKSNSSSKGVFWYNLLLRSHLSQPIHCALVDVPIVDKHVNSLLFVIII